MSPWAQMTWHRAPCFYSSPYGRSSSALLVPLSVTKTPPHTGNIHSHSDKLNKNRASLLQCTVFWVIRNTDFFTGPINLFFFFFWYDNPSHNIHLCNTRVCSWQVYVFEPVFVYTRLFYVYCRPYLNESPWLMIGASESCSEVLWISLNLVLSTSV